MLLMNIPLARPTEHALPLPSSSDIPPPALFLLLLYRLVYLVRLNDMTTSEVLREKHEQLLQQYDANVASARSLRRTLERDILPGLVDELGLDGLGEERAKMWLNDIRTSG